jgi:hypothetical protein
VERHPHGHQYSVGVALTDQEDVDDPIDVLLYASRSKKQGLQYEPLPRNADGAVWRKVPADSILTHFSALTAAGDIPLGVIGC